MSLSSLLLGQPRSVADCLAFITSHAPSAVRIGTTVNELPHLPFSITQYHIVIHLDTDGHDLHCQWICAGFRQNATAEQQADAWQTANNHLAETIAAIEAAGYSVGRSDGGFPAPAGHRKSAQPVGQEVMA